MKATPVLLVFLAVLAFAPRAQALEPVYTGWLSSAAVSGYDPVAYFTEGKPVKGSDEHRHDWKGAVWSFSSAANRDLFVANPGKYAPQYGGYCAYAVSEGYTASSDPTAWKIVDDKLYLNYSHDVQATWSKDIPGRIRKADVNWPRLLAE